MIKRILFFVWLLFFSFIGTVYAADFEIEIQAESGFYSRENELVSGRIDFGRGAEDVTLYRVRQDGSTLAKPFYFVPGAGNSGTLHWILTGVFNPLEKRSYLLHFNDGVTPVQPFGCDELRALVSRTGNIVLNPYFENEEQVAPETALWKGDRKPENWTLTDFPWASREAPDLKAESRLTGEEAYKGENSVRIVAEIRNELQPQMIRASASSDVFALEPDTRYVFSCYVKIADWRDAGSDRTHQGVSGEVVFLDSEQKRVPGPTSVYRIQADYLVSHNPKDDYLGKWVRIDAVNTSPPETRYGRVHLSTWWFAGTVYFDNIELLSIPAGAGEPVVLQVGQPRRNAR